MEYRITKNGNLELPVLGMGCWAFGGGDYWGTADQGEVNKVVHTAYEHGITYFDTAEVYNDGRSEKSLGVALGGIPRDRVLVGTKISPSNCYPDLLARHCENSLNRLRTDYIDLYMIHWPIHAHSVRHFTNDENIIQNPPALDDAFEALINLKRAGKIRHIGVSNFGARWMEQVPEQVNISVNQLPYNLLCRAIEFEILPYCVLKGTGIMAYMAMFQGILAGIYGRLDEVPPWQSRTRHFNTGSNPLCRHGEAGCEEETRAALHELIRLCDESGLSLPEIAIRWIIGNKNITCALIGTRSTDKLMQNLKATDKQLPEGLMERLNMVTDPVKRFLGNHFDYFEGADHDRTRERDHHADKPGFRTED